MTNDDLFSGIGNGASSNPTHPDTQTEHLFDEEYGGDDSTYYVSPDGFEHWTPRCDDQHKPYINQYFNTVDEAYEFYKEYGRICGFDVRKYTSFSKKGKLINKYIVCSHAGSAENSSSTLSESAEERSKKRRRTSSRRCHCNAQIMFKSAGPMGYVVKKFIEVHNHSLASSASKQFLRCNRNVTFSHQNFIYDLNRANIGPMRAHSVLKEMLGSYENVGATATDFKNFARDMKARIGEHDADMIVEKFKVKHETTDKSFFYKYKVDEEGHLTGLFWADAVGRRNYSLFGDTVSFDPTFRTNKYCMVFIPFTGVDNHWNNVTFAAALLSREDSTNFMWLLDAFNEAMDHLPTCVITDQCLAIKKALLEKWPSVKHRLCMWHIMNKLSVKVSPSLACNKVFMGKMKSVVWADHLSTDDFEDGWKSIINEYELQDNTWLTDMYNMRKEWIPAYFNDVPMSGLMRTTSRSESSNFYFQHFHKKGDTLVEFYTRYDSAIDRQRHCHDDDNRKSDCMPNLETLLEIEKDAAQLYTRELFYFVREEIKSAIRHTSITHLFEEDGSKHLGIKDKLLSNRVFEVIVNLSNNHVQCSCNLYSRKGYLCKHAFAGLHQCEVTKIPRDFIKTRWSKNAERRHSSSGSYEIFDYCDKTDDVKVMVNEVWFDFQTCMSYVGYNREKVEKLKADVKLIKSNLQDSGRGIRLTNETIDLIMRSQPQNEISIQNPNTSRNKGCGSRIKSSKEVSMDAANDNRRKCGKCGKVAGHNARTCPLSKNKC